MKGCALDDNVHVVDLGAIGGIEGVYLTTVGGVDLVEGLDPAEAGEIAVVELVLVGEEHLGVIAVGDGVLGGDRGGGAGCNRSEIDGGEVAGEESVGLELLA